MSPPTAIIWLLGGRSRTDPGRRSRSTLATAATA